MQGFSGQQRIRELGREGEDLAASWLRVKRYRILERNYRCRSGEVDLIVEKGAGSDRKIQFVEVKTRRSTDKVSPRELISPGKQRHISRVAQHYVAAKRLQDVNAGFAVLIIDLSGPSPQFEWIEDAFSLAWGY